MKSYTLIALYLAAVSATIGHHGLKGLKGKKGKDCDDDKGGPMGKGGLPGGMGGKNDGAAYDECLNTRYQPCVSCAGGNPMGMKDCDKIKD